LNVTEALDIIVMSGPYDGETHRLSAPHDPTRGYVLGRRPDCDLAFAYDDWVSGQHARLFRDDDQWFVEDLDSTNKTHLGRRRRDGTFAGREQAVGLVPIVNGQLIQLGRLWIRVRFVA
jgi:pSer/pThr/pTyr-binding forkhead associated (FHA) protein